MAFAPAPEKPPHHDEPPEAVVMPEDIEVLPDDRALERRDEYLLVRSPQAPGH